MMDVNAFIKSIGTFNIRTKTNRRKRVVRHTRHKPKKVRVTNLKKAEVFYKKKKQIPKVIYQKVDPREIIYGARALNKRFPSFLDKHTEDYDIFSTKPLKDAKEAERALDRAFGGNFFAVKRALHPGTYKVVSLIDKQGYADYTKPDKRIPYDVIDGKKYVKLDYVKKTIKQTLSDPESKYRWKKDRDALNRIMIYEKMRNKNG